VLGKARTPRKRRLSSEEAKHLVEDQPLVQKAAEVQWKCRPASGSGWKTAGGNWSAGMCVGRNQSEALGLGCRDKSGIGAVAATFLFRGCQRRKKRVSGEKFVGCSCQTAGSCRRKCGSRWEFRGRLGVSGSGTNELQESRWCRGSGRSAGW